VSGAITPAGLGQHHLAIGPQRFALADLLPLSPRLMGDELSLPGPLTARKAKTPAPQPAVWIRPMGNIGNRTLQYLTARHLASLVPGAVVQNIDLAMWGQTAPAPPPAPWKTARLGERWAPDIDGLAECLRRGVVETLVLDSYAFHLGHYPPRATCRALLPGPALPDGPKAPGFGPDELVCSVRGAEILSAIHKHYYPLPPAYYAKLAAHSGLKLVFFGQLGDDAYSQSLRTAFPQARFVPGVSESYDFERLRRSANIAVSLSTFTWAAAWLSKAERVFLPVGGIFDPLIFPGHLFLPLDEPSFTYIRLPYVEAINLHKQPARFFQAQELLGSAANFMSRDDAAHLVSLARLQGNNRAFAGGFEPGVYTRHNSDAALEAALLTRTALDHYLTIGAERITAIADLDPLFYAQTYPDALADAAAGRFKTLYEHYIRAGAVKGYAPRGAP